MGIRSRKRTRIPASDPATLPPPSRRHGSAEWRDWTVLWVILSLVPQADILRGAGLVCASWRRLALDEPLLWRHIDLPAEDDEDADPPAGWQAMACSAVRRSAGRCESFRGRVDGEVLLFLAHSAPSLRSLYVMSRFDVPCEEFITAVAKVPLLEQLVISHGPTDIASLVALVDHCPRLQLLDAGGCHRFNWIDDDALRARLESKIKDLRLPHLRFLRLRGLPVSLRPKLVDTNLSKYG